MSKRTGILDLLGPPVKKSASSPSKTLNSLLAPTKKVTPKRKVVAATTPKEAVSRVIVKPNQSNKREQYVTLNHYYNIFNVIDDLKYQLPSTGQDRFFGMFLSLFNYFHHTNVLPDEQRRQLTDQQARLCSDFGIDSAYYVRLTDTSLITDLLYPSIGAALNNFDKTHLANLSYRGLKLSRCLDFNKSLKKLSQMVCNLESVGCYAEMRRLINSLVNKHRADLADMGLGMGLDPGCDCCSLPTVLLIHYNDKETQTADQYTLKWQDFFNNITTTGFGISFNVSVLLSHATTPEQFQADFKLQHETKLINIKESRSSLYKIRQIYNMGFYKRIYALHLWTFFLAQYLWSKKCAAHETFTSDDHSTSTSAAAATSDASSDQPQQTGDEAMDIDEAPALSHTDKDFIPQPITLMIDARLRLFYEQVPSLALAHLQNSRKITIQYI